MDEPTHEVLDTTLEYEVRHYAAATWWIRTKLTVTGRLLDHVTEGQSLLRNYREGANQTGQHYSEKAPTLIRIQTYFESDDPEEGQFIMYQYMCSDTDPPEPTDDAVSLQKLEPFQCYVRSFEELKDEDDFIAEYRNTMAFLSEMHVPGGYHDDHYFLAGYGGGDTLWANKKEIWILKETYQ